MAKTEKTTRPNLRHVPSVDQLLRTDAARELRELVGIRRLTNIARSVTAEIRSLVRSNSFTTANGDYAAGLLAEAVRRMQISARSEGDAGIRSVVNATGVLLHTNLGRAPLSEAARAAIDEAARYCTVEYAVETGARGGRGARVESLLKDLTGAEDALVVNNCAAAALLILTVLAGDGETIVSRGELVEIGGDFRVPDVMASSGTRMIEVGTTNRTHLEDYRSAINAGTRLIMRVHPSNYRIVGFASSPGVAELASLAHEAGLPLYEDAGSGQLNDLRKYGVIDEPIVREIVESGAAVKQESRLYNSAEGRTYSMRSKEEAHDYRYFPEPDLPHLIVDEEWQEAVRKTVPELPENTCAFTKASFAGVPDGLTTMLTALDVPVAPVLSVARAVRT